MTTRLQEAFKALRESGRKGVIPYITAGDPELATTYELLVAMARGGATAIELGVPFSDPAADGPVIQRACERALSRGVKLRDVIEVAGQAAKASGIPIVLFSYLNPLLRHGLTKLVKDAADAGLAGVLVTDLPAESARGFSQALQGRGLDLVSLVAPTSTSERIAQIAQHATGFLYAISVTGVTGTRQQLSSDASALLKRIRGVTDLPVAVGFGISNAEQAREAWAQGADAVIVGSAIVGKIEEFGAQAPEEVERFVRELVASQAVEA
ncbi:MAG TPA: tryptophan synthase subunit alpha [Candidatus Saccharimonadales bacterium]|nr:tryptophan synthase subunit alpha [Candidatus Saccharimonadales bacterium]